MKRIIVVHGWGGSSRNDWMPWITVELEKLGYAVLCPDMPHTESPMIEDWVPALRQTVGIPDEETYFIGHSIGCQAIMRYLETIDVKVGGAVFVAGWFDLENLEGPDEEVIAKPWIQTLLNTQKIQDALGFLAVVLSDNDPWVPYEKTKEKFERLLGSKVVTIPHGGHMTTSDGYEEFDDLIDIVQKEIAVVESRDW